ncbi:MAG: MraY family glycosyltransferase [Flavipsychrobacter sp.]
MIQLPEHLLYALCFITSLIISLVSIPQIILISSRKRLFDVPDSDRKIHSRIVPNLGGVGIFFAFITTASLFIQPAAFVKWNFIIASSLLLFLTGIMDDMISLSPSKKFLAQLLAALIVVGIADIRLTSLHGILGVHELSYWYSITFSIVGCIFITNAVNLIDGIDGLAASIGTLSTGILGIFLAAFDNPGAACLAFSLMGAIIGFLRFNIAPAKIFMGDTGSLLVGFMTAILCIMFVNSYNPQTQLATLIHGEKGALVVALSILFVPVFDSFRVFITRIVKGVSPFKADRTHLHHYLLDLGFTHSRTVTILITANILIIVVSLVTQDFNPNIGILGIFALSVGLYSILYFMRKKRMINIKTANTKEFPLNKESRRKDEAI